MNTYKLLSGETIRYLDPTPEVADFLARVRLAAADPAVSLSAVVELVYGVGNPLLDTSILPGRPMVTRAVHEDPVYQILLDQIGLKRVQAGTLNMAAERAAHTLTVSQAAAHLGISTAAVRQAVADRRLPAILVNGQYWLRPEAVAGYKVSNRGPKAAEPAPGPSDVIAKVGGTNGISLSVRFPGHRSDLLDTPRGRVVKFNPGWVAAVVRTTAKGSVRAFEIEPAEAAEEEIAIGGLFVRGAFRIVKKYNATKAAMKAWQSAASPQGV